MTLTAPSLASQLASIVGPHQTKSSPENCVAYSIGALAPTAVATPTSAEQVSEIIRFAAKENLAVIPCGSRSKLHLGAPPSRYDLALDMTSLNQIAHYDPADLTLSVDAGITLSSLSTALLQHKQFLPLSAPFADRTTIGGTIASGLDSPLRQLYGTARDFLIGAEFVNGTGALTKSGGRVVKNVTGYDLHKLLIGSLGALAVITRLNFRTFPLPLNTRGFVAAFQNAADALALRRSVADSPLTLTTFEILSPAFAHLFQTTSLAANLWHVCIGFAGTTEVCNRVSRDLVAYANDARAVSAYVLSAQACSELWQQIREAIPTLLNASPEVCIFKITDSPSNLSNLFRTLLNYSSSAYILSRSSGLVYFTLPAPTLETCNSILRTHSASLLFAPSALWPALQISSHPLSSRVTSAFDPSGIFAFNRH